MFSTLQLSRLSLFQIRSSSEDKGQKLVSFHRSRSHSRDRRRRSRSRESRRSYRSRSRERRDRENRDRENRTKIDEITKGKR